MYEFNFKSIIEADVTAGHSERDLYIQQRDKIPQQ